MTPSPSVQTDPKLDTSRADGRSAAGSRVEVRLSFVDRAGGWGSDQPTERAWKPSSRPQETIRPGVIWMLGSSNSSRIALPPVSGVTASPRPRRCGAATAAGRRRPPAPPRLLAARRETSCAGRSRARRCQWCRPRGVAVGDRDDMRHAVLAECGEPPELLAPEVVDLGIGEPAHRVLLFGESPSKLVKDCAHPHGAVAARWNAPSQFPSRPS